MKKRIYLFDVDGTLLWSGRAGVRGLEAAFEKVLGIERGMEGIVCDGKTDPAIVREVLSARGRGGPESIEEILESYVKHLPGLVSSADGYRILPGVIETLEYLHGREGILCGLATGNVEPGARAKLERGGLNKYFPVGGFGSDSEDRAELVRIAVRRARELLKDDRADAVIIGDTPRDVAAAHAAGVPAWGVASGHFDAAALSAAGADLVLEDLRNPETWVERTAVFRAAPIS
jgi:phosphoglycolate phosphatase-like HAD superfamily hydrolase